MSILLPMKEEDSVSSQKVLKPSLSSDLFELNMFADASLCGVKKIQGREFLFTVGGSDVT